MFIQQPKEEIDVGELGNGATGDILYDGGEKLNSNFNAVYNSFGDQRYYDTGTDVGNQTIHATGYYQKVSQRDFRTPLALGTQWDVDTSTGAASAILSTGKAGECIKFINSNGSISINKALIIQPNGGSFVGIQGALTITQPFSKVECWCISNNGTPIWDYSISPLFSNNEVPIDNTFALSKTNLNIPIAHASEYSAIKLLLTGMTVDGKVMRHSEVNLLIDTKTNTVHSTEYAVIKVGESQESDEIVDIKYDIGTDGIVNLIASTQVSTFRLAVKSIAVQKIGSA